MLTRVLSALWSLSIACTPILTACGGLDDGVDGEAGSEQVGEAEDAVVHCPSVPASCRANISSDADSARAYDPSAAVAYAVNNYNVPYGSQSGQNAFRDYSSNSGGNCTNFVSQALLAGLTGYTTPAAVYRERYRFDSDAGGTPYQWYFRCDCDRGPAFTSANKMYEYARKNQPSYKGLHFQYVTNDTASTELTVSAVKEGDVVFADFDADGSMDHAMLVTRIYKDGEGYDKIRLTYQTVNDTDRSLREINNLYQANALFYVYRPTDYNPSGL